MLLLNLFYFVIAIAALVLSGYWLVKALSKIASYLKISEFVLGFILMAVSTSLPELFIGIKSALLNAPSLSFGNVIGANILDLTVAIGIPIIIARRLKIKSDASRKDAVYMFLIAILPIALYIIGSELSVLDGLVLLIVFILYARNLLVEKKGYAKPANDKLTKSQAVFYTATFVISIGLLFKSAEFVVKYAVSVANEMGLPEFAIGVFIVSLGTTLPELTVGILAVLTKHYEIALGDSIGSVITNSTLVLGVASFIHPITTNFNLLLASGIFMIIVAYMFSILLREKKELDWKYGVALLIIYMVFVVFQFYFEFRIA